MAWLNATPKPPPGSKRAKTDDEAPKISRLQKMRKGGGVPAMPPNPAPHIIANLLEIGLTDTSGMAAAPVSWGEISAWQANTHIRLAPWESRLIRRLSTEYLAESRRAEEETCPPPWRAPITARERDVEEQSLEMLLG